MNQVLMDWFGVRLPTAGFTTIWTITLSDPTSLSVPAEGFVSMVADDGTNNNGLGATNAAWRYKDVAPAIGSSAGDVHRMEMTVIPEPASLALMVTDGFLLLRRRRG